MRFMQAPGAAEDVFTLQHDPAAFAILAIAVLFLFFFGRSAIRHRRRSGRRGPFPLRGRSPAADPRDPSSQLSFVSRVDFETKPLLNREERPILLLLEGIVREVRSGHRVMAQTSLGEVIRPRPRGASAEERDLAFRSINSKRLDFAIFNDAGRLVLAVEYQGSGHYHQDSFMRDAVKKEALRKAGVALLEVPVGYDGDEIRRQVLRLISPGTMPSPAERVLVP